MRTRAEIVSSLLDPGLIAVVRTERADQVLPLAEALLAGGLTAVEITLTTPDALRLIAEARQRLGERAIIGAGSVLNRAGGKAALDAGAEFLVSPVLKLELIELGHAADRAVMVGAYTPTEAQLAHESGADFVKLFPADKLGPGYIKALRAPMPHLRIVPTGGVDLNTAADFLKAGCAALGVGSSLMTKDILKTSNWTELTRLGRAFVDIARSAKR